MRFIPSEELKSGTIVGRDIIFTAQKAAMVKKGTVLTERYIQYLQDKGYLGVYISDIFSEDVEIEETVDPEVFQSGVEAVMFENIQEIMHVSDSIVSDIVSKKEICTDLLDLRSYDLYTYHHCVNVAVLSVVVGRHMGLSQSELTQLCQAGLLHDLGKSRIPEEILNKPDRLTDTEFGVMKNHPQYSYDIISESHDISAAVKQAVLCHHENENGSGYPGGKEGQELSIISKIVHAVDVYDALTSKRPYKAPYESANAFEYLREGIDVLFNKEVIEAMMDVIPPYPTGIDVYLSNGERALVINHSENRNRPIVRLIPSGKVVNLHTSKEYADIYIARSGLLPFGSEEGEVSNLNESRSAVKIIRKNIIVIDTNKASRLQLENILVYNANIKLFETGLNALAYVKEHGAPDLIITDTDLPFMDGLTTVMKIRNATKTNVPVIFLSADNTTTTIVNARQLGNTDYILKPANPVYIKERASLALYNLES